jgi:hypothetical protein
MSTATAEISDINGPGHNGLSARSLLYNAVTQNPKALRILMDNPLNDALFDPQKRPYMSRQLVDPNARDVMDYIVSCALDRSARVRYVDPASGAPRTWDGEMGLCRSWSTKKPSVECLRLVSSCLFARTNRLHRWVPAWFGGQTLSAPRDRVEVTTKYSKSDVTAGLSEGTDIPAFSRGWKPGYVGRCTPKTSFALSIPGPQCAGASLRVCEGIHGCGPDNARFLGDKNRPCEDAPQTFTCPSGGFFAVMTKPSKAAVRLAVMTQPDKLEAVPPGSSVGSYPAPEKEVFSFMEGAFFGNLFEPDELTRFREVVLDKGRPDVTHGRLKPSGDDDDDAIPHRHIFACYSQVNDEEAVAELNARVCAKRGSKRCFPTVPRRCHFKDPKVNNLNGYHCKWRSDDGLYRDCEGDDGVTYPAITVYLHEPCALSDAACAP